jgi:hydroxyethylthiazole kinase-like uncharacterized protein yjeF
MRNRIFEQLAGLGLSVIDVRVEADLPRVREGLSAATLIVDGLFGTGLDREISGAPRAVIELINQQRAPVVALDLPSGVDADDGAILGAAVNATLTVTFGAHKRGLHQAPGRPCCGEIVCVPIGTEVPPQIKNALIDAATIARIVPPRAMNAHKGSAGRVLVIAGSEGHTGAALLSGSGALRAGAGLVTIAPCHSAFAVVEAKVIEMMTARISAEPERAIDELTALAERADAVVLGPGFGLSEDARRVARALAVSLRPPTVIDADALTACSDDIAMLQRCAGPRVLTPHPGEASRLLGIETADVQRDRFASAALLAKRSGHISILKGACTIVAAPDGALRVCDRGTPALAVGGTGDVLAGTVAALLCTAPAFDAASAGVWLHAVAGELAANADRGLLAREVADALPRALTYARKSAGPG